MADPRLQAQLDAAARQKGFKNYDQWSAFQRNSNGIIGAGTGAPATEAPPQNWLQTLLSSIPMTPAYLLGHVSDRMNKALGGR